MTDSTLEFPREAALGRVFRVDTASVWAEATDHDRLTRIGVGSLVAFQGPTASEYLIGMLDRVTRDLQDDVIEDDPTIDEGVPTETRQRDLVRVVLLGTYRTVEGTKTNTFKRGADSYPLVESLCWVLEGPNLQKLMGLLSQQLDVLTRSVVDLRETSVVELELSSSPTRTHGGLLCPTLMPVWLRPED